MFVSDRDILEWSSSGKIEINFLWKRFIKKKFLFFMAHWISKILFMIIQNLVRITIYVDASAKVALIHESDCLSKKPKERVSNFKTNW